MKPKQKFGPIVLLVLFSCYSLVPPVFSGIIPQSELSGFDQSTGTLVPTKPALAEAQTSAVSDDGLLSDPISNSTEFLDESPLSPATEEGGGSLDFSVGFDFDLRLSDDPFYGASGSWGQSYDDLYWLKRVRADDAWSISRGTGVSVAVIDTGFDFNHPDISANTWFNEAELNGLPGFDDDGNGFVDDIRGWDFVNGDNDPQDDNGHGTHVAGIIGAVKDNGIGIAGVAPESKILAIKVLDQLGSGFVQNVISAIRYAADLGAKVINLSLGVAKNLLPKWLQRSFESAVKYAIGKGSVVVAAAGNEASNVQNSYPAGIRDVIAVGAVEPVTDKRAWFSNFGKLLDFAAPGVDVLSLRAGGTEFGGASGVVGYSRASGTSMASPVVAGVVALLRAWNPQLTLFEIYDRLKRSAVDLGKRGFDAEYGYGLVDAYRALTLPAGTSLSADELSFGFFARDARRNAKLRSRSVSDPFPSGISAPHGRPVSRLPIYDLRFQKNHLWQLRGYESKPRGETGDSLRDHTFITAEEA